MSTKPVKIPNADHPITMEPTGARVIVTVAGQVMADSTKAVTLREAAYPAVQYIPRADVDMTFLQRTDHATYCPYKGDCSYFSIPAAGERGANAVWTYEAPYEAVESIAGHLAFYSDRVEIQVTA